MRSAVSIACRLSTTPFFDHEKGTLIHSLDTTARLTKIRFTSEGTQMFLAGGAAQERGRLFRPLRGRADDVQAVSETEFPYGIGKVAKRGLAANGYSTYTQLTKATPKELLAMPSDLGAPTSAQRRYPRRNSR